MQNVTDVRSILLLLIRLSPVWMVCTLLCAAGIYCFSAYVLPPSYTASATLYIHNSQTEAPQLDAGNMDTSRKLVDTCAVLLQSDRTLEQVLRRTGGKYTSDVLRKMVHMEAVDRTEVLRISVTAKDPQEAANLCNTFAACAPSELLRVLHSGGVEVVDTAREPEKPSSPNVAANTILGGLLGFGGSVTGILAWELLDRRVRTVEDLERRGVPVLAKIPAERYFGREAARCTGKSPDI